MVRTQPLKDRDHRQAVDLIGKLLEATSGIEPEYADLQSAA